jgi:hypothetical protein
MSGFGTRSSCTRSAERAGLPGSRAAGRQSETAAEAIAMSADPNAATAAACISRAETTGTTVTPAGGAISTGPSTNVTR